MNANFEPYPHCSAPPLTEAADGMRTPLLQALGLAESDDMSTATATATAAAATAASHPFSDTVQSSDKKRPKSPKAQSKKGPKRPRKRGPPEFKVRHDYHDYSNISYDDFMRAHPLRKPARELKSHLSFPKCLHKVLDAVSLTAHDDIISWCPHGRAFIVHKPEEFAAILMPLYFTQTKFSSFQRQLNIYDFKRLTRGPDSGACAK